METSPTNKTSFSPYPLFVLSIYFACGVLAAKLIDITVIQIVGLAISIIVVTVLRNSLVPFVLPLIFVPLGAFCFLSEENGISKDRIRRIYTDNRIASYEPVEIEAVLVRPPEPAAGGAFVRVDVEQISFAGAARPATGIVRLFVVTADEIASGELQELDLHYGSRVLVMCRLEREERFQNPGTASSAEILDQQGIDATAVLKSPLLIEKLGDDSVFLPRAWVYERRRELIDAFRANLSPNAAGVMIASLLGDKHFLDRETAEVFRDGGTFHVLVISGLHITFIGGVSLWFISLFTQQRTWQAVLASTFLWTYTFAVGAEIPVVRASLMFTILLAARLVYRTGSLLNALGACTLILLSWRPGDLFSASFQLTYISVGAIVGCSVPLIEKFRAIGSWMPSAETPLPPLVSLPLRRICEMFYWNEAEWQLENNRNIWSANLFKRPYFKRWTGTNLQRITAYIFEGLIVSTIVQLWLLPLSVIYFHRVSPASIFLNLWVGVLIALESFAAVAALALSSVADWLAAPFFLLTDILNSVMMSLPASLSAAGAAGMRVPVYSGAFRVVYLVFLAAIVTSALTLFRWAPFEKFEPRLRRTAAISCACAMMLVALIVFHPLSSPIANGRLTVDFLDVGQGDSIFITFPNGETMLVDGGGQPRFSDALESGFEPDVPRVGEAVVSEFLWEKGYSTVDHVVATHADADHIQGLVDVVRNFDVGSAIVGSESSGSDFEQFRSALRSQGVELKRLKRGDRMSIGGVEVAILHPANEPGRSSAGSNDNSVVIFLSFGSHRILLTGDIERPAEQDLVFADAAALRSDVVKVAHHGSRTSSTDEFVDTTQPAVAVISVGRRSRFGHPHQEVVERWKRAGAQVITTGEKGTVTIESDGSLLTTRQFVP